MTVCYLAETLLPGQPSRPQRIDQVTRITLRDGIDEFSEATRIRCGYGNRVSHMLVGRCPWPTEPRVRAAGSVRVLSLMRPFCRSPSADVMRRSPMSTRESSPRTRRARSRVFGRGFIRGGIGRLQTVPIENNLDARCERVDRKVPLQVRLAGNSTSHQRRRPRRRGLTTSQHDQLPMCLRLRELASHRQ